MPSGNDHRSGAGSGRTEATVSEIQGRYRIRAVAELTGVAVGTLRAWERRYGIPAPARSDSAYRLYGEHDVALIRRLRELCARGLAPAEAAQLLRAEGGRSEGDTAASRSRPRESRFAGLCDEVLQAVAALDPTRVEAALRRGLVLGSAHEVFAGLVSPVLGAVGEQWERGQLEIAHEHMVSTLLEGLTHQLLRSVQPRAPAPRALLACWRHETHVLPLMGVALRLAERGWRSVLLGARTPPSAVAAAVEGLRPALVGLSLTVDAAAGELAVDLAAYARACGPTPWLVGGLTAERHRAAVESRGGRVVASAADLERALDAPRRPAARAGRTRRSNGR